MKWEDIENVSKDLKLTPIKGKDYATVNQRVKAFRKICAEGSIESDIVTYDDGLVIIKAVVKDGNGKVLSTGLSYEREGSSMINKTSFIENCETSAVGRALGFLGLGIDTSMASADEMKIALEKQSQPAPASTEPIKYQPRAKKPVNMTAQCQKCLKDITPTTKTTGETMSVAEIVAFSKENYGGVFCTDCMKAAQERMKAAKK